MDRRADDARLNRIEARLDQLGGRIDGLTERVMWAVVSAAGGAVAVTVDISLRFILHV